MVTEMKLIISEKEKVIHTLTKEIKTQPLVKSIEEFQYAANAKLTEMIEEHCGSGDEAMEDEEGDANDDDEEEDASVIPKKRKR